MPEALVAIARSPIGRAELQDRHFGLGTMCVGGGQGMTMLLERLS